MEIVRARTLKGGKRGARCARVVLFLAVAGCAPALQQARRNIDSGRYDAAEEALESASAGREKFVLELELKLRRRKINAGQALAQYFLLGPPRKPDQPLLNCLLAEKPNPPLPQTAEIPRCAEFPAAGLTAEETARRMQVDNRAAWDYWNCLWRVDPAPAAGITALLLKHLRTSEYVPALPFLWPLLSAPTPAFLAARASLYDDVLRRVVERVELNRAQLQAGQGAAAVEQRQAAHRETEATDWETEVKFLGLWRQARLGDAAADHSMARLLQNAGRGKPARHLLERGLLSAAFVHAPQTSWELLVVFQGQLTVAERNVLLLSLARSLRQLRSP